MTSSAVTFTLHTEATGALPLMAHPQRSQQQHDETTQSPGSDLRRSAFGVLAARALSLEPTLWNPLNGFQAGQTAEEQAFRNTNVKATAVEVSQGWVLGLSG
jgi:hypothetical protein